MLADSRGECRPYGLTDWREEWPRAAPALWRTAYGMEVTIDSSSAYHACLPLSLKSLACLHISKEYWLACILYSPKHLIITLRYVWIHSRAEWQKQGQMLTHVTSLSRCELTWGFSPHIRLNRLTKINIKTGVTAVEKRGLAEPTVIHLTMCHCEVRRCAQVLVSGEARSLGLSGEECKHSSLVCCVSPARADRGSWLLASLPAILLLKPLLKGVCLSRKVYPKVQKQQQQHWTVSSHRRGSDFVKRHLFARLSMCVCLCVSVWQIKGCSFSIHFKNVLVFVKVADENTCTSGRVAAIFFSTHIFYHIHMFQENLKTCTFPS